MSSSCFASHRVFADNSESLRAMEKAHAGKRIFEGIGEAIGDAIRVVVEFLLGIFTNFFGAFDDFIGGLTRSLGINDSFLSLAILLIGLLVLWGGLRAFLRGSIIGGIFRTLIGLFILSWLMM